MDYNKSSIKEKGKTRKDRSPRLARERAILFGFGSERLDELESLLLTSGVASVGQVLQKQDEPDPDYYFREGKRLELSIEAKRRGANILACDDELSPRQARNLELSIGIPVVDRTAIILDIFATHAQSREGKLQVELAQLEYNMARMRGLWTHLERLGGGIGTRGPGESQLETDRRLAKKRHSSLLRQLKEVDMSRQRQRKERLENPAPKLALFGYTNSGKSTIMNDLSGASAPSADRLFHTLDSKTSYFDVAGEKYIISDTVGLIDKLPHGLVRAFKSTLDEAVLSDILLIVVDASGDIKKEINATNRTIKDLGIEEKPKVWVFNKIDLLEKEELEKIKSEYEENSVFISALNEQDIENLKTVIDNKIKEGLKKVDIFIPYKNVKYLNLIYKECSHISQKENDYGYFINALVSPARAFALNDLPGAG